MTSKTQNHDQTTLDPLPPLLYKGSVKNVRGSKKDQQLLFEFTDRYSVFDWGEMPDQLSNKGESLAHMCALFFSILSGRETWNNSALNDLVENEQEKEILQDLQANGLNTHYLHSPSANLVKVQAVDVVPPKHVGQVDNSFQGTYSDGWDYDFYTKNKPTQTLVPLEVIFRFGVPKGSSLLKRIHDQDYCKEIGLQKIPKEGDYFSTPIIEFSTKLESTDRYVSYSEAKKIAGLNDKEWFRLKTLCKLISLKLKQYFDGVNLELWDGKLEFAFIKSNQLDRDFMLVDTIGPDELRIIKNGVQLSKEVLRQYYSGGKWHKATAEAKKLAKQRNLTQWQNLCSSELGATPPKLDRNFKELGEQVYTALANELGLALTGKTFFTNAKKLDEVVAELKKNQKLH